MEWCNLSYTIEEYLQTLVNKTFNTMWHFGHGMPWFAPICYIKGHIVNFEPISEIT